MTSIESIPYLYSAIATGRGDAFAIRGPDHTAYISGVAMISKVVGRGKVVPYKGNAGWKVNIRSNYGQGEKYDN